MDLSLTCFSKHTYTYDIHCGRFIAFFKWWIANEFFFQNFKLIFRKWNFISKRVHLDHFFRRKNLNYFNFYDYKNTIFTCEGNNLKLFHQLDPPSENKEKKNMSIVTTHVFITINVISKWTEYIFMVTNNKFQLISLTNPKTTTKTFTTKSLSRGIYEKER